MRHVFQIQDELEELAGRLAAENINHTQLNGIEKLVQACKKLAKMPQNSRKLIELDLKFRILRNPESMPGALRILSAVYKKISGHQQIGEFESGSSEGLGPFSAVGDR